MGLKEYSKKRKLKDSKEPMPKKSSDKKIFVVQRHEARRLHYDFRISNEGVLKSWAVPEGIPQEEGEKRLAIRTEDHPMGYAKFHGTIPTGNYGAGKVEIWDKGIYDYIPGHAKDISAGIKKGTLAIKINGKKIKGNYALIKIKNNKFSKQDAWLLLKMKN